MDSGRHGRRRTSGDAPTKTAEAALRQGLSARGTGLFYAVLETSHLAQATDRRTPAARIWFSKPDLIRYGKCNLQRFVKRDHGPPVEGAAIFRRVHRRVVLRAARSPAPRGPCALAWLWRLYWCPLYAFVRPRGYGPDDARDLTQGFFLNLLERRALVRVDLLTGIFRALSEGRLRP